MNGSTSIAETFAWEALDSRGVPTVACEIVLESGARGSAIVPSGASTGSHEAVELRDGGDRYSGKGVQRAVAHVNKILGQSIRGIDASDQRTVDATLRTTDGSANLASLGANAVLAVSVAAARAAAAASDRPLYAYVSDGAAPLLPMPMVNIISGGAHAGRSIDVQDFLVVPLGANTFAQAIEMASRIRLETARVVEAQGHSVALIADEGGLGPILPTNRAALELLTSGIENAGFEPGVDAAIAIDVAATQLHDPDTATYHLAAEGRRLTSTELIDELVSWTVDFPIVSIEDALAEDDWEHWPRALERLGARQLLGDDLFATNAARVQRGIETRSANAVLVKPNQIGTLSDASAVVLQAHRAGLATVLSARSGETEDSWLSDLAVGWRTGQIKVGSTMRSERTAKWNRLLEIEARLGADAQFAGSAVLKGRA